VAVFLAYVDAVPGRLYPLVGTLLELAKRGHHVAVRCGIDDLERLRALGLDARSLSREIDRFEPDDWRAQTRFGALSSGLAQFGERARVQLSDLEQAIEAERPDVLFVDEGAWGAAAAAERSGLPWAFSIVSPVPLRSRDVPPFGLGLAPRCDRIGHLRDRLAKPLTLGTLERIIASHVNPLRAEIGLPPVETIEDVYLAASVVIAYTAEPFEYPRSDWPAKLRLVGPGLWEPPADPPVWLDTLDQPLVLVTCSTLFQNDRRLAEVAAAALAGGPFEVVVTTAGIDPTGLPAAANVRVERFLPHAPLLDRAACVVCHAGMGITQKALAHGVPVVAVPFGRDQPEVARRVEVAGAGVRLPARKLTPERLRDAVLRAIELRPGAERIASAFAAADGAAAAARALEGLVPAEHQASVGPPIAEPARQPTAVLFVDMVGATALAVSLGDRAWAELLERYHRLARGALERHQGWLMDTAGDGFFAIFDEAADAIRCALDIRESAGRLGLELRSGVHLGHCWRADEKCAGADVHVGARLAGAAGPGEVLISEEAAERARRAAIAVSDRGVRSLKGLPGPRRVFAVGDGSLHPSARLGSSTAVDA
jgi:MGT family glycosyltransferase